MLDLLTRPARTRLPPCTHLPPPRVATRTRDPKPPALTALARLGTRRAGTRVPPATMRVKRPEQTRTRGPMYPRATLKGHVGLPRSRNGRRGGPESGPLGVAMENGGRDPDEHRRPHRPRRENDQVHAAAPVRVLRPRANDRPWGLGSQVREGLRELLDSCVLPRPLPGSTPRRGVCLRNATTDENG